MSVMGLKLPGRVNSKVVPSASPVASPSRQPARRSSTAAEATGDTRPIAWESRGALYLMQAEAERRNNDLPASHASLARAGHALARLREILGLKP